MFDLYILFSHYFATSMLFTLIYVGHLKSVIPNNKLLSDWVISGFPLYGLFMSFFQTFTIPLIDLLLVCLLLFFKVLIATFLSQRFYFVVAVIIWFYFIVDLLFHGIWSIRTSYVQNSIQSCITLTIVRFLPK